MLGTASTNGRQAFLAKKAWESNEPSFEIIDIL